LTCFRPFARERICGRIGTVGVPRSLPHNGEVSDEGLDIGVAVSHVVIGFLNGGALHYDQKLLMVLAFSSSGRDSIAQLYTIFDSIQMRCRIMEIKHPEFRYVARYLPAAMGMTLFENR
jgi:hypothetical protein